MPVAICSMHRSGAGMITGLLRSCGLDLGLEKDIVMKAGVSPVSPWTNKKFLTINQAVLSAIQGAWDFPPAPENVDRLKSSEIPEVDEAVIELIDYFKSDEHWGWKDERNCFTLQFWRRFLPELKVILCVRNPLDVYFSLHKRHGLSSLLSLNLWHRYNWELARAAKSVPTIITHFESYFADPAAELRRVAEFLDLNPEQKTIDKAAKTVKTELLQSSHNEDDLKQAGISENILEVYQVLSNEGGPVFEEVRQSSTKKKSNGQNQEQSES